MNLILEDNADKVVLLFYKYPSLMTAGTYITCYQSEAEAFMRMHTTEVTLFLDYELLPGCGDGVSFLKHVIAEHKHWLKLVVAITGSPTAREEMERLCKEASIPFETLR